MGIENLNKVIRGRTCAILLPGSSIQELNRRITELQDVDICYSSVNNFEVMDDILSQINKRTEVVLCSAKECNVPSQKHIDFLKRDTAFLTEEKSFHHSLNETIRDYGDKLCFFSTDLEYNSLNCPSKERPFHFFAQASFVILMSMLAIGEAKRIVLFGADGGDRLNQGMYINGWEASSAWRIGYDTGVFNMTIMRVLGNVLKTHDIDRCEIINCSPYTLYAVFPIGDYDTTIKYLQQN